MTVFQFIYLYYYSAQGFPWPENKVKNCFPLTMKHRMKNPLAAYFGLKNIGFEAAFIAFYLFIRRSLKFNSLDHLTTLYVNNIFCNPCSVQTCTIGVTAAMSPLPCRHSGRRKASLGKLWREAPPTVHSVSPLTPPAPVVMQPSWASLQVSRLPTGALKR